MSSSNGSSSLLEQVLQDCTPAQQARALKIARQTGLDDDDPSFVIPLATGKMQVLLEDAPERMGELLGQWRADVESAFQAEVAGVKEAGQEAVVQQTQKAKRELVEAHQKASKQFRQEIKETFSGATERAIRELHAERNRQDNAWLRERVRRHTSVTHLVGGVLLLLIGGSLGVIGMGLRVGVNEPAFQFGQNLMEMEGNLERITKCINADQSLCQVRVLPPEDQK